MFSTKEDSRKMMWQKRACSVLVEYPHTSNGEKSHLHSGKV